MTDGDGNQRLWVHTALLESPDGRLTPAFIIDERVYPDREAARADVNEAFAALQRDGIAAEIETVLVHRGEPAPALPSWPEYRDRGRRKPTTSTHLRIWLGGELNRERLNGLQDALGMRRGGRLSDDSHDNQLGAMTLSRDGDSWTTMVLHRKGELKFHVTVSSYNAGPPSAEQVALWRDQVVAAATAAGLRAAVEIPADGQ